MFFSQYTLVFIFILLGIALPVIALTLGRFLRPNKPSATKGTTYESGNEPVGEGQVRFNIRYYLFALMFVANDKLGLFALVEMFIFVGLLAIGLLYAWKKKVLKWNSN